MKPKHNPAAKALAQAQFRAQVVKPRKGRGSYSRKGRAA